MRRASLGISDRDWREELRAFAGGPQPPPRSHSPQPEGLESRAGRGIPPALSRAAALSVGQQRVDGLRVGEHCASANPTIFATDAEWKQITLIAW